MEYNKKDLNVVVEDAFLDYAKHVLGERALPSAQDGLKYSTRQLLYAQYHQKNTSTKKFIKGQAMVGHALKLCYIHGDVSAADTYIRMGKPFAVKIPLETIQGDYGSINDPKNHAAPRYWEGRLSPIADTLFRFYEKQVVETENNYDDTEQIPRVLPCIGFYPIINGVKGIAVGMSSSIPQFNLREVNNAIIRLIKDKNIDFDSIYCAPDFCNPITIINANETKESIKNGYGKAIMLRGNIIFNSKTNELVITELPPSVYANTVIEQIAALIEANDNLGIKRILNDSKNEPYIILELDKNANPTSLISFLYKHTSVQASYSVNMVMLDKGRYPRIFTWQEALQAYIDHIRIVYKKAIQHDLKQALAQLHIQQGYLIALEHIDEVIKIIKSSNSTQEASGKLVLEYNISQIQAKAILDLRLSRLTKLEYVEVKGRIKELEEQIAQYEELLDIPSMRDDHLIAILSATANEFGDSRRTRLENLARISDEEFEEETQLFVQANSTTYRVDRLDNIVKLPKVAYSFNCKSTDKLLVFTKNGRVTTIKPTCEQTAVPAFLKIAALDINWDAIFITQGADFNTVIRVPLTELEGKKKTGLQAIKLKENDKLIVFIGDKQSIITLTTSKGEKITISVSELPYSNIGLRGRNKFKGKVFVKGEIE